ncbi:hypothetical protein E3N88_00951 [Mikania micrantha]|uniref:Uncharacterized protein n=1 Tax=Mikania micrantha TaxID=192012 RepID=A0A5N6PZL6_9ASTR|nr:hypothetical protein E3N88_00951 [Mikania micrantha]
MGNELRKDGTPTYGLVARSYGWMKGVDLCVGLTPCASSCILLDHWFDEFTEKGEGTSCSTGEDHQDAQMVVDWKMGFHSLELDLVF